MSNEGLGRINMRKRKVIYPWMEVELYIENVTFEAYEVKLKEFHWR